MIIAYTDGSSRGNPGPGGWGAIVHMGEHITELGGREDATTNNRMELTAAIAALRWIKENMTQSDHITLKSDSKYVIQGITAWIAGWKRNGWMTAGKKDVGNKDLWQDLDAATKDLSISWVHVDGHAGIAGNERCDEIATSYADKNPVTLYTGLVSAYAIDIHAVTLQAPKKRSSGTAYSYLSFVDGVIEKHKTWAECESRVKGKKAKFKKALSVEDEAEIIREWTGRATL